MIIDNIDYFGIDEILPKDIKYFKEELICSVFDVSKNINNIHNVVSVCVESTINSIKIVNTPIRVSNEGQRLSGKKLLLDLVLDFTIKYTTDCKEQYIYIFKESLNKICYIAIPLSINEIKIEELFRKRKFKIKSYIEDLYVEVRNKGDIYVRTLLLLNLNFDN